MRTRRFANRTDAGRQLARLLLPYAGRADVLVLGLPHGGMRVAEQVARELAAPLDVYLVGRIGVPGHPGLAMGAIAEDGTTILDDALIRSLRVPRPVIEQATLRARAQMERRDRTHGRRPRLDVRNRTVVVVDEALAAGSAMEAAVLALRQLGPAAIIVAAPIASPGMCDRLRRHADRVVCVQMPADVRAVGYWYDDSDIAEPVATERTS